MYALLVILLIITSLLLIVSILMQSSKGDGMVAMTAGSSVLGSRGAATFLAKFTQWAAVLFFVLVILINVVVANSDAATTQSVVQKKATEQIATPSSSLPMPANVEIEEPTAPTGDE